MKKIITIISIAAISFISCKKEEENQTPAPSINNNETSQIDEKLIGHWAQDSSFSTGVGKLYTDSTYSYSWLEITKDLYNYSVWTLGGNTTELKSQWSVKGDSLFAISNSYKYIVKNDVLELIMKPNTPSDEVSYHWYHKKK